MFRVVDSQLTHVGINQLLVGVKFHGFASGEFCEL